MILTATSLVAIENIKAGDIVISTNPDTMEKAEKRVVETYVRTDTKLIHLVVNGEEIITTETHPFYVNKRGFINAGELKVGDELLDVNNNVLAIEDYKVELPEESTTVYNFQVEDFHTYHVGDFGILVHNANYQGAGKLKWDSWRNYEKVTQNNKTYAKIGNRLYSKHAVDRMQPSGNRFGPNIYQAGGDYGRSVAPMYVEEVLNTVKPTIQQNGNLSYISGTLEVITNPEGAIVTIMTYR